MTRARTASRSSRSGRATACRTSRAVDDGGQGRVRRRLCAAGCPVIEVTAFVSPKWVPQMADAGEVFAGIPPRAGTRYTALVPNLAGLERALSAGARESRSSPPRPRHSAGGTSIRASLTRWRPTRRLQREPPNSGSRVRAYLSTAFGCPFEGAVDPTTRGRRRGIARRDGCLRSRGQRHDRDRASRSGADRRRRRGRARRARPHRAALPRHARHRAGQRARRARSRHRDVRRLGRRARRMPLRAGRDRQSRDRGSDLHARRPRHRHRRRRCRRCSRPPRSSSRSSATPCRRVITAPPARPPPGPDPGQTRDRSGTGPWWGSEPAAPRRTRGVRRIGALRRPRPRHPRLQPIVRPGVDDPLERNLGEPRVRDRELCEREFVD